MNLVIKEFLWFLEFLIGSVLFVNFSSHNDKDDLLRISTLKFHERKRILVNEMIERSAKQNIIQSLY